MEGRRRNIQIKLEFTFKRNFELDDTSGCGGGKERGGCGGFEKEKEKNVMVMNFRKR